MARFGVDVSKHNGTIDWETAKDYIDCAILRCGYGDNIGTQDDKEWLRNVTECERLGIPYGVYLYSYAATPAQAESECDHVIRLLKGHNPSLPVYIDLEERSNEGFAHEMAATFCERIGNAGYVPGVYTWKSWFDAYIDMDCSKWLAEWGVSAPSMECDIWQFTSDGNIPGIGRVDANEIYISNKPEWVKDDTGWWYRYPDGSYPHGEWLQISGEWYYFNDDGYMCEGWKKINGIWYYLNPRSGEMVTGWKLIKNKWYWFSSSGAMFCNGFKQIDNRWYGFAKKGDMIESVDRLKIDPTGSITIV